MKRSRTVALLGMGVSVLVLTACEDPNEIVPIRAYASIDECVTDGVPQPACIRAQGAAEEAYDKVSAKFASEEDCEDKTGPGNCEREFPGRRGSTWRPAMIGFVMASAHVAPQAVVPSPTAVGGRATAAGVPIAGGGGTSTMALRGAAAPSVAQIEKVQTQSRGGFGSTATRVSVLAVNGPRSHGG